MRDKKLRRFLGIVESTEGRLSYDSLPEEDDRIQHLREDIQALDDKIARIYAFLGVIETTEYATYSDGLVNTCKPRKSLKKVEKVRIQDVK